MQSALSANRLKVFGRWEHLIIFMTRKRMRVDIFTIMHAGGTLREEANIRWYDDTISEESKWQWRICPDWLI